MTPMMKPVAHPAPDADIRVGAADVVTPLARRTAMKLVGGTDTEPAAVDEAEDASPRFARTATEDRLFGRELAALRPRLVSAAYRLCYNITEAEDLASDATLRAWTYRDHFQPGTSLSTWTRFILRNLFLSKSRRARFSGGSIDDLPISLLPSCLPPQWAAIDLADALKALGDLPPEQRIAIELVGAGATYDEAAIETDTPANTVKSRVSRGRARLQELLG